MADRQPPARRAGATRTVGAFLPKLTQKAVERFGFPNAAILADWSLIVGPALACFTAPQRLRWPRGQAPENDPRAGATLVIRVDGPAAIEVQHKAPQIIDRINTYFGYRAVTDLRIVQAPVDRPGKTAAPKAIVGSGTLDEALQRLSANIARRPKPDRAT